ncbi:MAG: hypothetical protein ACKO3B_11840, partial [Bacteroidota bacterium]
DSLKKNLGFAGTLLNIPDVAGAMPELPSGWMSGFQSLKIDPEILLKKAGFTGLPADQGEFSRLVDIAGAADPGIGAGDFSGDQAVNLPELARDHFADKKEALSGAMDELDRFKEKYHELESLPEVNLKFVNTMKGKPFTERLIPGLWLRVISRSEPLVELAPVLRYRLTGRISLGVGYNSRIGMVDGLPVQVAAGPLAAAVIRAARGFEALVEYRRVHIHGPDDEVSFTNWFTGLRKNFPITRSITGFAAAQYDWNRRSLQLTPGDRLQTRMGVEFKIATRKESKSVNGSSNHMISRTVKSKPNFPGLNDRWRLNSTITK